MPASSQGLPTSGMRATVRRSCEQAILTASIQGRCGVWPSNSSQPAIGALLQLVSEPMTSNVAAVGALVDRQRQAPVALLGDHPVVHVRAASRARAPPAEPPGCQTHRAASPALIGSRSVVHGDEPLVDQPEDQIGAAAPADAGSGGVLLRRDRAGPCARGLARTSARDVLADVGAAREPSRLPADRRKMPNSSIGAMTARPLTLESRSLPYRSQARCGRCRCPRRR